MQDTRIRHIYLSAEQATRVSSGYWCHCCCVSLSAGARLGPHHEPMGSDSDGDDYESLAALLAVSRLHHSPNTRHTLLLRARICRGRGQPATVCDIYVVDARNRRERGEKQPSSREAHIPCFPSAHLQSLTCVCAKFLWSGELVGVHSRTIAVVGFFSRGLSSNTTRGKFGFHYKGRRSDSARLILPSESQAHFLFRMRYYSRWPQKERRNRGPHVSSLRKSYHVSERLYLFSGLLRLGAMLTSSLIFDSFPV